MSARRKVLIGVGILAVLIVAGVLSVRGSQDRGAEVRFEEIGRRDLVATVTANGYIRARRSVDISADVSGRVVQLNIDEGDEVEEGEILLRIDPTQWEAILARNQASQSQALAQAKQQEANLIRTQREYERASSLWARDSTLISRQQLEDAETNLEVQRTLGESAQFGVEQANASVREARENLAKTVIRAPMSGKVTRLNIEQGETAIIGTMNNPGSLLLTISDLSVIEAVMEVDETDVPEIAIGDSAVVELDAFPDQEFTGRVTEIGNSAIRPPSQNTGGQTQTIDFEVVITLTDPVVELRPDLSSTAEIVTERRDDAIAAPIIAVTVRDEGDDEDEGEEGEDSEGDDVPQQEGVFVLQDGTAKFVEVEVGIAGQDYFEILSGLSGGETVVSGPYQVVRTLRDGDPVREEGESSGPGARRAAGN